MQEKKRFDYQEIETSNGESLIHFTSMLNSSSSTLDLFNGFMYQLRFISPVLYLYKKGTKISSYVASSSIICLWTSNKNCITIVYSVGTLQQAVFFP